MLRLIQKWIKVGAIDNGKLLVSETGTGQGQPISPLLANAYLHYVLDVWFEEVVKPRLKGEAYEIRLADDAILYFQHKEDAEKVLSVVPKRFEKYGLALHPEKTRLIEFGRYPTSNARRQGKKPATFDFLGLTHIMARSRKGKFTVHVKTIAKRLRRGLKAIFDWCKEHRHDPVTEQQKSLNAKIRGHYQYYGRPTNYRSLAQFYRRGPAYLARMAEPPHTRAASDVGPLCGNPTPVMPLFRHQTSLKPHIVARKRSMHYE